MDLEALYALSRRSGAYFDLSSLYAITLISGADRYSFLESIFTNSLLGLKGEKKAKGAALLNRKGQILFEFQVFEYDAQTLALLHSKDQSEGLPHTLDEFIFAEDVQIKTVQLEMFFLFGPKSESVLDVAHFEGIQIHLLSELGFLVLPSSKTQFINSLQHKHFEEFNEIPEQLYHLLRIESGLPYFPKDLTGRLFTETSLMDTHLDSKKGCYPGQEIVTRISQRGQSPWGFYGLKTKKNLKYRAPNELTQDTKTLFKITSWSFDAEEDCALLLGYGKVTEFAYSEQITLVHHRKKLDYQIVPLPFYFPKYLVERAEEYYESGLKAYHANQWKSAETFLKKAIEIYPGYGDAFEALGMVAEKNKQYDQAIKYNQEFAHYHPKAVMARTNLSRLYMLKGWIDKAEEEQNKAQQLYAKLAVGESSKNILSKEVIEEQNRILQAERKKKETLFLQVLELDPEDEIALFGLSKGHTDRSEFTEALPYFERLFKINEKYSAAWPLYIKALFGLNRVEEAKELAKKGKEICESQGDLMPAKMIEIHLKKALEETS